MAEDDTGTDRTGRDGTGRDGTGRDGTGRDGTGRNGTGRAGTGELRLRRVFDAPRELVFHCMTEPDHLTHFWGPVGVTAPREHITVDARPGGVFETLMVSDADGSEYATRAVFDEVRPPELLVWTESHSGMRVRSEFVALGPERTEVRIHQTYVPEAFLAPEARAGFMSSLDRFDAYLAGLAARPGDAAAGREPT